jgi:lysophospholipid acyltransferase (LPLAT)-like uncharacterized protein
MQLNYYTKEDEAKPTTGPVSERLALFEELMSKSVRHAVSDKPNTGRNSWTRTVDLIFAFIRRYAPPIHRLSVVLTAVVLYCYARLVAFTARLRLAGERAWPDIPAGCVLALWHRDAPSLLIAFLMRRPLPPCSIMISGDSRGDYLALLCRLVGLHVVRGSSDGHGWQALGELANALQKGACVIITADGGGPARVAKVGAVALASSVSAPLLPLAVDCYPAIEERHKWDRARNPLPFGSILIAVGSERVFEPFTDAEEIELARAWLEEELDRTSMKKEAALQA